MDALAHAFSVCTRSGDPELRNLVAQLQRALERAELRSAMLQEELDEAALRAHVAEREAQTFAVAFRWRTAAGRATAKLMPSPSSSKLLATASPPSV